MSEKNPFTKTCACCEREIEATPGNLPDVEYISPVGHLCRPCRQTVKSYVTGVDDARRFLRRFMVDPNDPENREEVMKFLELWGRDEW